MLSLQLSPPDSASDAIRSTSMRNIPDRSYSRPPTPTRAPISSLRPTRLKDSGGTRQKPIRNDAPSWLWLDRGAQKTEAEDSVHCIGWAERELAGRPRLRYGRGFVLSPTPRMLRASE
jgi:hypothetical protein